MPDIIDVPFNYGEIIVIFHDDDIKMIGDNAVVKGEQQDIIKWLKPFDGVAIGSGGSPQFEEFKIVHISDNL